MGESYRPFPDVADWPTSGVAFAEADKAKLVAASLAKESPDVLRRARDVVTRLAAIETGAIEELYDLERGFTINAALDSAILESLAKGSKEKQHALITSQLAAYDSVLDFVTGELPFIESWIRGMHKLLCEKQDTYTAWKDDGSSFEAQLVKGEYKQQDNHVRTASSVHCYAPAIDTAPEMERLTRNVNSELFRALHAVDQAAYIHYGFVAIHPFADGNGRVARALTSIPTYRHFRVPILITADQKTAYFESLSIADKGQYTDFRVFIRNRIIESVLFLDHSARRAKGGTPAEIAAGVARNFVTRGGYSHVLVDEGATRLLNVIESHMSKVIGSAEVRPPGLQWSVSRITAHRDVQSSAHRRILSSTEQMVQLLGLSTAPAEANCTLHVGVEVPIDAGNEDFLILECGAESPGPRLEVPVRDVLPKLLIMTEMNVTMFAEDVMAFVGKEVQRLGRDKLVARGFAIAE